MGISAIRRLSRVTSSIPAEVPVAGRSVASTYADFVDHATNPDSSSTMLSRTASIYRGGRGTSIGPLQPRHLSIRHVRPLRPPDQLVKASKPPTGSLIQRRIFHSSERRQDVFFLAVPAFKSSLLNITRFSLIVLPFVFRYK